MTTLSPETIKKAVEIAPDFYIDKVGVFWYDDDYCMYPEERLQFFLDALAAALVAMLEDMPTKFYGDTQVRGFCVTIGREYATISNEDDTAYAEGGSRTENTINAIVEFSESHPEVFNQGGK